MNLLALINDALTSTCLPMWKFTMSRCGQFCSSAQSQYGFEADRHSGEGRDRAERGEHSGHQGLAGHGVVAQPQDLAVDAEQHLLRRHESADSDRVHADALDPAAA